MPKIKMNVGEIECFDVPTMYEMSDEEYRGAIDYGLVHVDRHGVLRSCLAGYPLAATREQMDIFIAELQRLRLRMAYRRSSHLASVDDTDKSPA